MDMERLLKIILGLLIIYSLSFVILIGSINNTNQKIEELYTLTKSQEEVITSQKHLIEEFDWKGYKEWLIQRQIEAEQDTSYSTTEEVTP